MVNQDFDTTDDITSTNNDGDTDVTEKASKFEFTDAPTSEDVPEELINNSGPPVPAEMTNNSGPSLFVSAEMTNNSGPSLFVSAETTNYSAPSLFVPAEMTYSGSSSVSGEFDLSNLNLLDMLAPFIILSKNLLNYFINWNSFSMISNIIINDISTMSTIKNFKTTSAKNIFELNVVRKNANKLIEESSNGITMTEGDKFIKSYVESSEYMSGYMKLIKDTNLVSDIDPNNYTNKLYEQKINFIENRMQNIVLSENIIQENQIKIDEHIVLENTKNLFNIESINKIISNISNDNMKILFNMENNTNKLIFAQLYHLSILTGIIFRLYPLGLYVLLAENIYGVRDVTIRIEMLKQLQIQIRLILNNLKKKLEDEKLENLEIPIPASTSDPLYKKLNDKLTYKPLPEKKTFKILIDELLKNTIVPNKIIELFKIKHIIHAFGITSVNQIEYFTPNSILVKKRNNTKKYFIICIVILIAILFFKLFIKK